MINTYILSWDSHTIFTYPARLFDANVLYPSRDTLTYSEHLVLLGALSAPIRVITRNPVLPYNILLLVALVFSAFSCYLLIKELTESRWGALIAGLFFSYNFYRMEMIGELHVLVAVFYL